MGLPRRSKIFDVVAASALLCGCAGATLRTALEVKDTTRHPDGVVVEPPPAIPPPAERGSSLAGVVALRQPISNEQIGDIVHRYVGAFIEGDMSAFEDMMSANAVLYGDAGRSAPRMALIQSLRVRWQQHAAEYRQLHVDIARLDRLERWSYDDLGRFTDPPRPAEMREGDVYVRVPIIAPPSTSGDPLFRNTLVLLIRRDPDHVLRIAGVGEMDSP